VCNSVVVDEINPEVINNTICTPTESILTRNTASPCCIIIDSGASDIFLRESDINCRHTPYMADTNPAPIQVGLPNGNQLTSIGKGRLTINKVSTPAYIFPNEQLHTSLLAPVAYTDQGCTVTLTNTMATITDANGALVLEAPKLPSDRMWQYTGATGNPGSATYDTTEPIVSNNIIRHELHAEIVQFWRQTLGSPTQSTLLRACTRGYLRTIPQLTAKMVRANPSTTLATAKGHLDLTRKNQRSTRTQVTTRTTPIHTEDEEANEDFGQPDTHVITKVTEYKSHTDLTGQLPFQSRRGNSYMLVSVYDNYVYMIPMPSKDGPAYVTAYRKLFAHYRTLGKLPKVQRLDNETSQVLTNYLCNEEGMSMDFVPPNNHRRNKAERAIRDVKNHFMSTHATADPNFPMDLWDESEKQLNSNQFAQAICTQPEDIGI
jgi:hypothetical protein